MSPKSKGERRCWVFGSKWWTNKKSLVFGFLGCVGGEFLSVSNNKMVLIGCPVHKSKRCSVVFGMNEEGNFERVAGIGLGGRKRHRRSNQRRDGGG